MKILFVGDVYGSVGVKSVEKYIPMVQKEHKIDFTIVNGENVSSGKSLSRPDYDRLMKLNIDVFTMGNHTWFGNKLEYIREVDNIVTPANMHAYQNEKGTSLFEKNGVKIRVSNILGQAFMMQGVTSPYEKIDTIIENDKSDIHIVDIHAEATSEKMLVAWTIDGQVSAILGTHTHVQTADNRVLPKGTAFISDVGMCGSYNSAIGVDIDAVIKRAKYGKSSKFIEATGEPQFSAVVLDIDEKTKKARSIERINITPETKG